MREKTTGMFSSQSKFKCDNFLSKESVMRCIFCLFIWSWRLRLRDLRCQPSPLWWQGKRLRRSSCLYRRFWKVTISALYFFYIFAVDHRLHFSNYDTRQIR